MPSVNLEKKNVDNVEPLPKIDDMEEVYNQLCARINQTGGKIFVSHKGSICAYMPTFLGKDIVMGKLKIETSFLKMYLHKSIYEPFIKWMIEKKSFYQEPVLNLHYYMYEENGKIRADLQKESDYFVPKTRINQLNCTFNVFLPFPEKKKQVNGKIEQLLNIIFDGRQDKIDAFKNFCALLVCENRILRARPTLVMYGARGTGKGVLTHFLRALTPGTNSDLPADYEMYNTFLQHKLLIIDENDKKGLDNHGLYVKLKKWSGSSYDRTGGKYVNKVATDLKIFSVLVSNEDRTLYITDFPESETNNQFLAVYFARELNKNEEFGKFQEANPDFLQTVFDEGIGHYIHDVLVPLYLENRERYYNCRYGFPIAIDKDLLRLIENSDSNIDVDNISLLEALMGLETRNVADSEIRQAFKVWMTEYEDLIEMFKLEGFAANQLLVGLSTGMNQSKMNFKSFRRLCNKYKLLNPLQKEINRCRGKNYRGLPLDKKRIAALLEKSTTELLKEGSGNAFAMLDM